MVNTIFSVVEYYLMLLPHVHILLPVINDILFSHNVNNVVFVVIVNMVVVFLREIGLKVLNSSVLKDWSIPITTNGQKTAISVTTTSGQQSTTTTSQDASIKTEPTSPTT